MYRCKVLHRFLWNSLHQKKSSDLDGVSINDLADDDGSDARYKMSSGNTGIVADVQDDDQMVPKGIVFSRESVLHSMPVYLYIQVFSGGAILTDSEFAIMEEAIANKCTFDEIPAEIREKVWSHETQRTSKVLGTLADLGLVAPHKIGMSSLVKILRAGYTDGRDGVLSQALKDNALGGLFRFNKQLGKRNIDVKKRLKEKLLEPVVKLLFENAKREAQLADNPGAFSNAKSDDNGGLGAIAFRSFRHGMDFEKELGEEVVCLVRESGEDGLTLPLLMEKLHAAPNTDVHGTSLRYILKEHGDGWLLRPFSLVPSAGSASTLQVVFEGEKDTLSYPWLKMDGGTNCKFLFAIQRKLLALILQNPGITEDLAYAKLDKLLSLQDTREAMSLLVDEGLVYTRAAATADTKTVPVSLFGSQNPSVPRVMKLVGNVLSYDRSSFTIHYFPHVECIQRFGSIVQDYQNEVSEFHFEKDSTSTKVMEIFGDGELEAEMHKTEMKASSLSSWWHLFSDTYEELVQSIASPVRAEYSIAELGDQQFSIATCTHTRETFVREDFELENVRKERLACSFWRRRTVRDVDPITQLDKSSSEEDKVSPTDDPVVDNASTDSSASMDSNQEETSSQKEVDPCVIYVHGMSSSRKECVYMHRKILAAGFSLFALDLSGSGLSGGNRVSFGYFEHDDLRTVVDYLYATGRASAVGIWGRDVGSAAALLHVRERLSYRYDTMTVSKREAKKLELVEDKEDKTILCIPPVTGLRFRLTKYSASNGDFVLLAVNNVPVQGLSAADCYHLIWRSCRTTGGSVRLQGFRRSSSSVRRDKFIFALTADSAYGDMEQVIWDMLQMITKSAERRSLFFPSTMVTGVQKILTNSIGKAGGFSFRDVRLLDSVSQFMLPCLFISASKKDFFMPEHARALCDKYGGPKSYIQFTGQIDDNRPAEVVDTVLSHFSERFKLLR
ncbi:hypothetical protein PHYBOEH_010984 [Phytophthora boehmeriae]|uniref:Serine aminopeptidase S33 domain-containing protein n=1 Tax=Phytophthora boehmeriae TaxID=109152 RepID=A0A8T1VKC7_9STRA|nr:hypothetical protein PHYBOEH_010984 [Phytophthora boehmeriae]